MDEAGGGSELPVELKLCREAPEYPLVGSTIGIPEGKNLEPGGSKFLPPGIGNPLEISMDPPL